MYAIIYKHNKNRGKYLIKKVIVVLLIVVLLMSTFVACGEKASDNTVGVLMPTKDLQRWNQDGDNMKTVLEAKGYTVDLQYARNDVDTQVEKVENLITKGVGNYSSGFVACHTIA